MSTNVAAAAAQEGAPAAAALVTEPAAAGADDAGDAAAGSGNDDDEAAQRSCRDILTTATSWYTTAKDYVPDMAKPLVAKVESKVGEKLKQYPDAVQRVETFVDNKVIPAAEAAAAKTQEVLANEQVQARVIAPAHAAAKRVADKTAELLASERGQAIRVKATDAAKAVNDRAAAVAAQATAQATAMAAKASAVRGQLDETAGRALHLALDAAGIAHDAVHAATGAAKDFGADAAGRARTAAAKAKDFERAAATFIKENWRAPPSRSEIHASAVALANLVDGLVERNLPADAEVATVADANGSDAVPPAANNQAVPTAEIDADAAPTAQKEEENDAAPDTAEKLSEESISHLARSIAGKVSFRMKKRFVKRLEAAKGNLKFRTEKLLHSTNLIQYARNHLAAATADGSGGAGGGGGDAAEDEDEAAAAASAGYAKLTSVLTEAANVLARSAPTAAVVRTLQENARHASVTGVEVFQRGEQTARLAIVTTGKISAKCRTYATELAARIRERIQELEVQRSKGGSAAAARAATATATATTEGEEKQGDEDAAAEAAEAAAAAARTPIAAALADYVRATADTGAATMFVFRDELNQVLTHAYTASKPRLDSARAAVEASVVKPAWTALTQWKDAATARRAEVADALRGARAKGAAAMQQATTWTNVAFNEFAATVPVGARGVHALPAGFAAGLQYILQRMAQPRKGAKAADGTAAAAAAAAAADGEPALPVQADVVDAVVVAPAVAAEGGDEAAAPTVEDDEEGGDGAATFELDDESSPEWYFSVDGLNEIDGEGGDDEDGDYLDETTADASVLLEQAAEAAGGGDDEEGEE